MKETNKQTKQARKKSEICFLLSTPFLTKAVFYILVCISRKISTIKRVYDSSVTESAFCSWFMAQLLKIVISIFCL